MPKHTLREEYFLWLYQQIDNRKRSYRKLCGILHTRSFIWFVHNDDNRCHDGTALRQLFIEEHKLDDSHLEVVHFLKGECTIFEMLVALSQRINEMMINLTTREDNTPKWFHELLCNLEITDYDDMWIFTTISENRIDSILDRLMNRTYDWYGRGGLFPLKRRPPKDQSKVEIWYQLMLYLDENYGMG